jgi:hypothetical protein
MEAIEHGLNTSTKKDIDPKSRSLNKSILTTKTSNEWINIAKKTPIPKALFSEFWHEGEICFLFADSNVGKSILAVQIADSLSEGISINGFKLEAEKQPVLYYDFELSCKQFEARYSIRNEHNKFCEDHYLFSDNFFRSEINPDAEIPKEGNFCDELFKNIENDIINKKAKILIIDNLTYLKDDTERAKHALTLMKQLKFLKNKYCLSILVLAHTPKRDLSRPITQNDLSGSKQLLNFVDSCFAIGQSSIDKKLRYLKQIKARNTEIIYDTENVIICQLDKIYNFLKFIFHELGTEYEHLRQLTNDDRQDRTSRAIELKKQGNTNVEIAKKMGVSEGAVRKWLKKNEDEKNS